MAARIILGALGALALAVGVILLIEAYARSAAYGG